MISRLTIISIGVAILASILHQTHSMCTEQSVSECTVDQLIAVETFHSPSKIGCQLKCHSNPACETILFNDTSKVCSLFSESQEAISSCQSERNVSLCVQKHLDININNALTFYNDCATIKQDQNESQSGVYVIQPIVEDQNSIMTVFCDMKNATQQWIVVQRRFNGSVNFTRIWNEYKNGFGSVEGEFWLGNEKLHQLSRGASLKVRFDMWDTSNGHVYAEYSSFFVNAESDEYRLLISGYSGTAGNAMLSDALYLTLNNTLFSTIDRDNDNEPVNRCDTSGFWYNRCGTARINGDFQSSNFWHPWLLSNSPGMIEMKVAYNGQ